MEKIRKCNKESINLAAALVRAGGVIIYPTDTVYGLGADPYNRDAVNKIFEIKERDVTKPVPLLCSSVNYIDKIVDMNDDAKRLARRFWPGALTIITMLKDKQLIEILNIKKGGVRIPNNRCALQIINACNGILTGTSANVSGSKSVNNVRELDTKLIEKVDIIIDNGITQGIESTIIDVINRRIVREGYIKKGELEKVLGYEL